MTASQILTFSFIIVFHFHLMVCNSNSITKDAVVPFKHSTTNNLLISIHRENPTRCNNVSEFLLFHILQCAWQRPLTTHPTTFHVWKTRGCQCSFRLLMMGGVSPGTCWASYKYGIIKILIHCCILLDFICELYYDARIHEHQISQSLLSQTLESFLLLVKWY